MRKFEKEFRQECPETDKEFDNANYIEWLEKKLSQQSAEGAKEEAIAFSELDKLFQFIKDRQIDFNGDDWEEFVGHDNPNYYTTEELFTHFKNQKL